VAFEWQTRGTPARTTTGVDVSVVSGSSTAPERADVQEEYGRFEQLTAKLVRVPKSELDEKLRKAGND
jgi:hypothetical protein